MRIILTKREQLQNALIKMNEELLLLSGLRDELKSLNSAITEIQAKKKEKETELVAIQSKLRAYEEEEKPILDQRSLLRRRLTNRLGELQATEEKLSWLRKEKLIESDSNSKFKLANEIADLEKHYADLDKKKNEEKDEEELEKKKTVLAEIEKNKQKVSSRARTLNRELTALDRQLHEKTQKREEFLMAIKSHLQLTVKPDTILPSLELRIKETSNRIQASQRQLSAPSSNSVLPIIRLLFTSIGLVTLATAIIVSPLIGVWWIVVLFLLTLISGVGVLRTILFPSSTLAPFFGLGQVVYAAASIAAVLTHFSYDIWAPIWIGGMAFLLLGGLVSGYEWTRTADKPE